MNRALLGIVFSIAWESQKAETMLLKCSAMAAMKNIQFFVTQVQKLSRRLLSVSKTQRALAAVVRTCLHYNHENYFNNGVICRYFWLQKADMEPIFGQSQIQWATRRATACAEIIGQIVKMGNENMGLEHEAPHANCELVLLLLPKTNIKESKISNLCVLCIGAMLRYYF